MTNDNPFYLDPNRKHTEAEAELVMHCFGVDHEEAWKILNSKPPPEMLAYAAGLAEELRTLISLSRIFPVYHYCPDEKGSFHNCINEKSPLHTERKYDILFRNKNRHGKQNE